MRVHLPKLGVFWGHEIGNPLCGTDPKRAAFVARQHWDGFKNQCKKCDALYTLEALAAEDKPQPDLLTGRGSKHAGVLSPNEEGKLVWTAGQFTTTDSTDPVTHKITLGPTFGGEIDVGDLVTFKGAKCEIIGRAVQCAADGATTVELELQA